MLEQIPHNPSHWAGLLNKEVVYLTMFCYKVIVMKESSVIYRNGFSNTLVIHVIEFRCILMFCSLWCVLIVKTSAI